jgi:2-hydroxy-6-oxonona-2,4-dienedioate hydrolase
MSIWTDVAGLAFAQRFVDAGGIRTRILEAGEGPPLIFLHGAGGHAEAFARNIAAHARHFRVLAVDMLGHGYTDAPAVPDYTLRALVEHLRALVDALKLDTVSISGVSLGGMIGSLFAIENPQRMNRLALVTGMLMGRDEAGKIELADALERSRKATGIPSRDAVRARLAWLMHEPDSSVTEELVDVRFGIYADRRRAEAVRRISEEVLGGLLDDAWVARWSRPELMRGIRCPTLVLWTRYNPGLDARRAAEGMRFLADSRMLVFEHSAHWPQWEEPERFNREHLHFMRTGHTLDDAA